MTRTRAWLAAAAMAGMTASAGADSTSPTVLVYAPNDSVTMEYRTWTGSAWSSAASMPAVSAYVHWAIVHNCPTRNETACVTFEQNRSVSLLTFNGTSWSSPVTLNTDVGVSYSQRALDAAYENSGDLLIAYWNNASNVVGYRTFNGTALSSERTLSLPTTADVSWLTLYQYPRSNRILLLALDTSRALHASVWRGSSWTGVTTLSTNLDSDQYESYVAGFEAGTGGEGVIVYNEASSGTFRYRTLSGTSISATEQSGPTMGSGAWRFMRAATHPDNGTFMWVGLNHFREVWAARWNGTGFVGETLLVSAAQFHHRRQMDVAWQPDGARALAAYARQGSGGSIRYRVWNGSTWGAETTGTNVSDTIVSHVLKPADTGSTIYSIIYDTGNDLCAARWNGSQIGSHTQLHGTIEGMQSAQSFMVSVPVTPGPQEPDEESVRVTQWREIDPHQ